MRILHIGKEGNLHRFSAPGSPLLQAEIADLPMGLLPSDYIAAMPNADYIVADAIAPITAELISGLPNLRLIHSEGVAYNRIDLDAAKTRGVFVCNSQGCNAVAVAEHTILLMLGMLRNVLRNDRAVRSGMQITVKENYMADADLLELADCSVGLIGFGDIAQATARLLQAHGVTQIYYTKRNRLPAEMEKSLGVQFLTQCELLGRCDIVSLHVPVTEMTSGMANRGFFASMKPGSFFVNTGRGELVEDAALIVALKSGQLRMAGLDTLSHEPVQINHPLIDNEISERIIFSPHIGGLTASSFRRAYAMICEDILSVEHGEVPSRVVNG